MYTGKDNSLRGEPFHFDYQLRCHDQFNLVHRKLISGGVVFCSTRVAPYITNGVGRGSMATTADIVIYSLTIHQVLDSKSGRTAHSTFDVQFRCSQFLSQLRYRIEPSCLEEYERLTK